MAHRSEWLAEAQKLADAEPQNAAAWSHLAQARLAQDKLDEAIQAIERVLAIRLLREGAAPVIRVEVAPGELLDKWSILKIKSERISDPDKLRNVLTELAVVDETRRERIRKTPGLPELLRELKEVNERLWDIENGIRDCEKQQDFGSNFITLARSVYQTNDRRSVIKRQINELLGAKFREEKAYDGLTGPRT